MKVVIVGVGSVGQEVAESLARHAENQVVLIEQDESRCQQLAESLDALVLHGDGTDPRIIDKAGIEDAAALVATTGSDPINTVIAMLARQKGIKKIMVKLNDVWLRSACSEIGVTKVVFPKISAAAEMVAALYGFPRADFSFMVRGGLHVAEIEAGLASGKKISELGLPDGALIGAILRGDYAKVASPEERIESGDILLTLAEDEQLLDKVRNALANG